MGEGKLSSARRSPCAAGICQHESTPTSPASDKHLHCTNCAATLPPHLMRDAEASKGRGTRWLFRVYRVYCTSRSLV